MPVDGLGVEEGGELRVGCHWRAVVIGAAALAVIAAEDPAVKRQCVLICLFDGHARDAAAGVDMVVDNCAIRAGVDASVAVPAPYALERGVIAIALAIDNSYSKQDKCAKLRRYKQRLSSNPTKSRLDGISLFKYGRRVCENATRERWFDLFQRAAQLFKHLFDCLMIVATEGIRGDFLVAVDAVSR